ncbi:hypothetical protein [Virgibacillus ainsalahensis]
MPDLTLEEFQNFSQLIEADIFDVLTPEAVVNARNVAGGTAKNPYKTPAEKAAQLFDATEEWIQNHEK